MLQIKSKSRLLDNAVSCLKDWRFLGVSLINMLRMLLTYGVMFTVLELHLSIHLGMSIEIIGFVLAGRTGGYIFSALNSGYVTRRIGRNQVIAIGLFIEAFCFSLFPLVENFEQALLLATINGMGEGFVFTGLVVMMSRLVQQTARSVAVGIYRTLMDVGGIAGPIIFAFLYTVCDAWTVFLSAFFVVLLSAAILAIISKRPECNI